MIRRLQSRLSQLAPRDRRALLVGAVLLLPLLAWGLALRPWLAGVEEVRDRARVEAGLLARERALLLEAAELPARVDEATRALQRREARLLRGENLALAEAELVAHLQTLARTHRVHLEDLRSVQPRPGAEPSPGLAPLRLSLRGESDFQGVLDFVHALEADDLLLGVESLSVQPAGTPAGPAGAQAGSVGTLAFVLLVEGLAQLPSAASSPSDPPGVSHES